jgi:hypothetical protein
MAYKSAIECTDTPWNPGKAREMISKKLLKQRPSEDEKIDFLFALRNAPDHALAAQSTCDSLRAREKTMLMLARSITRKNECTAAAPQLDHR